MKQSINFKHQLTLGHNKVVRNMQILQLLMLW